MTESMTEEMSHSWGTEFDLAKVCAAVADSSPMPMAAVDGAGHVIRYVNVAFCLLTGKARQELLGQHFAGVAPCSGECLVLLDEVSQTGLADKHTGREHTGTHPLYWSYTMWPVLAPSHRQLGIMIQVTEAASLRDDTVAMNQELLLGAVRQHELTEATELLNTQLQAAIAVRIKTEEALIGSEKLASAGRMAAVLAHEINNP
ncbi:MAG: PAS domain-containing protein, partial [Acidobacteriaceae bacterium]